MAAKLPFFITDHSADNAQTGGPDKVNRLYRDLQTAGFSFVRYDWRWSIIEPAQGRINHYALMRYGDAAAMMIRAGLSAPMIILSSIPSWAIGLYKRDKKSFFRAHERYARIVVDALRVAQERCGTVIPISQVQVLNELNNRVYTPVAADDIPELCRITREAFVPYNRYIKLTGSVVVGNLAWMLGSSGKNYLQKNPRVVDSFDIISLDCYPGVWHQPVGEWLRSGKCYFACHQILTEAMEMLARKGIAYEIDEVGLPTNAPWIGRLDNEERQRQFFYSFTDSLRETLSGFERRGLALPQALGVYEALDEPPRTRSQRLARSIGWPEHDFGIWHSNGAPKIAVGDIRSIIRSFNP